MAKLSLAIVLIVGIVSVHTNKINVFEGLFDQVWEEANFDGLTLVYTWAPTFCVKGPCTLKSTAKKIWTIHGLWPYSNNMAPSQGRTINCGGMYNQAAISTIRSELEDKWPSYSSKTTDQFWKHEYVKHGTCAGNLAKFNSQLKYFEGSIDLFDRYDIKSILANGNNPVLPSRNINYPLSWITTALKKGLGVEPNLYCISKNRVQYLFEIRVCFDTSPQSVLIDCTGLTGGGKCNPGTVVYPPFQDYVNAKSLSRDELDSDWLFNMVAEIMEDRDGDDETMQL
ncbi:ribonuclease Oy-like [Lytechinus pictus]|uniref:ribonuclease Oy-like n=1 Tax=Lytechinus pictus TaxID=7653 RepID=UPI0030BA2746